MGEQGVAGYEGAKGPTLLGPIGPIGSSGVAGVHGTSGDTGANGYAMAGSAGATGPSGNVGAQGPTGPTGAQGPVGIVTQWTAYRDFTFHGDRVKLKPSDVSMVDEIAGYMSHNPSLELGIDGSINSASAEGTNQDLNSQRISAVRDALIQAGVPADKIQTGAFGDPQLRRNHRIDVLLKTVS
jgi:outer membrane protein OmpA-like peptidoglycan-associated protein